MRGFGSYGANILIVADTSPFNYLILIEAVHVLPGLYGRILVPPEVLTELRDRSGPKLVRERDGREVAARLGLAVAGTLAVLRDAALSGRLDLKSTLERLKQTTFRGSPRLFAEILAEFEQARRGTPASGLE